MNLIEFRVGLKNIGASDCTIVVSYHYAIFIGCDILYEEYKLGLRV